MVILQHILEWTRRHFAWWLRIFHRLEVLGINNLPRDGSAILAGNHSGGFDMDNMATMTLLEHFKSQNPARKRVWLCYWDRWAVEEPFWAPWVQKFSPIPISLTGKGFPHSLIGKIVEKGELIAIMPEGHSACIWEGYNLWKFYPGVIDLHLRYRIPIIPVANLGFVHAYPITSVRYTPTVKPPFENEVMLFPLLPLKLTMVLGEPVEYSSYFHTPPTKAVRNHLARDLRSRVKALIDASMGNKGLKPSRIAEY